MSDIAGDIEDLFSLDGVFCEEPQDGMGAAVWLRFVALIEQEVSFLCVEELLEDNFVVLLFVLELDDVTMLELDGAAVFGGDDVNCRACALFFRGIK